jgi:hypothetical protein
MLLLPQGAHCCHLVLLLLPQGARCCRLVMHQQLVQTRVGLRHLPCPARLAPTEL